MTTGLLVTGTDTGVGKTVVAVALLRGLVAHRHRTSIDIDRIADAYGRLARRADVVIVEGAGGALVPLNDRLDVLDIARALELPVLLVVGVRLGCLNHARLTALAIRARGLTLAGWIASRIDAAMPYADENVAWLSRDLPAPLVAELATPAAAADRATLEALRLL